MVWLSPNESAPAGLLGTLSDKGLRVTVVVDAAAALREVIRSGAKRVVLCEPSRLARADELIATLRSYYPDTVCWRFDPNTSHDAQNKLADVGGTLSTVNGELVGPSEQAARLNKHQPEPRTTEHGKAASANVSSDIDLPQRLVTEDEVTMLLGPVTHDDLEGIDTEDGL